MSISTDALAELQLELPTAEMVQMAAREIEQEYAEGGGPQEESQDEGEGAEEAEEGDEGEEERERDAKGRRMSSVADSLANVRWHEGAPPADFVVPDPTKGRAAAAGGQQQQQPRRAWGSSLGKAASAPLAGGAAGREQASSSAGTTPASQRRNSVATQPPRPVAGAVTMTHAQLRAVAERQGVPYETLLADALSKGVNISDD